MIMEIILGDKELDVPGIAEKMDIKPIIIVGEKEQWLEAINKVIDSGKHNKDGCRIQVNETWNFTLLASLLSEYADREITHNEV